MISHLFAGAGALALIALAPVDEAAAQAVVPAQASDVAEAAVDEIIVFGQGETRQTQTLYVEDFTREAPGSSPLKLVERLPGVAISGADAFGAYEWAARINIRGFNQNQLGFTLDGAPLGDMSYGNHNGLHISRAIISEDLGSVELAQGSGAVDVAASNNLGGALKFFSRDPREDFGVDVAASYGSDNAFRGYAHVETGEIAHWGTRIWGSYANNQTDKWKGDGEQTQEQYAFKLVQPLGETAKLTGFINVSDRKEQDYQDLSLGMIERLGYDWDNFGLGQFGRAVQVADIAHNRGDTGVAPTNPAAGLNYPAPIATADDAYLDAAGLRKDSFGYVKLEAPVNEAISFSVQGYYHDNEGQGLWGTPYVASPNAYTLGATLDNAPLSIRTTEYDIVRTGIIGSITAIVGDHTLTGGVWQEENDFRQARRFYGLTRSGPTRDFHDFQQNPFFTQWQYKFDTETLAFYFQDTWAVTDRLTLNAGFKDLKVTNTIDTLVINNAAPVAGADSTVAGSIVTSKNFLPQAGVQYDLSDDAEVFFGWSKNAAAYVSAATAGPFASRSQTVFNFAATSLEPETSTTYEGGVRLKGAAYQLGVAAYYVKFDDRLLAVTQGPGIVGNAPVLSNVGSVRTLGAEIIGSYAFTDAISLLASYSYNDSEYSDDVVNAAGVVLAATRGADVVNTPRHIANAELAYDDGALFGSLSANYLSDRYFTYTNVGGCVDGRVLLEAAIGYRLNFGGLLDGIAAQFNVTNLLDENYAGTIGTNGFVNSGDAQTLVAGAPRQFFGTLRKSF